jgi:hypothetical protein
MGIQNTARQLHIRLYFITLFIEGKNRDEIYYNIWNTAHTTDFYGIHHVNLF